MKNKRFIVNLSGVLLAFAIAFGGILAVWGRLDRERAELLSGGGEVEMPARADGVASQSIGVVDVEIKVTDLSQEELRQAVLCLEETSEKYPHEPMPGQLSMTEATRSGMGWLGGFFLPRLDGEVEIPKEYGLSCYLWAEGQAVAGEGEADLLSGYWEVSLSAKELDAVLLLNAVTGQVLRAEIGLPYPAEEHPAEDSLEGLLADYADSLGIETSYVISAAEDGGTDSPAHGTGDNGAEAHGTGDRGTDGNGTGDQGTGGRGAGEPGAEAQEQEGAGTGSREMESPVRTGSDEGAEADSTEPWGFRQRLENDRMAVCLEAWDAAGLQGAESGKALRFALYLETKP